MPTEDELFAVAHAHVAKWEGGYFDHPHDPGGVTMYGVSLLFLKSLDLIEGDIDGDGDIDRDDVLAITRETAQSIFRHHFWDVPRAATLPPLVAVAYYDLAVNAGTGRAALILQEAINTLCPRAITHPAPNLGPLTRAYSAQLAGIHKQYALAKTYLERRQDWYHRLAAQKVSSRVFLRGWLNRTADCHQLIQKLSLQWGKGRNSMMQPPAPWEGFVYYTQSLLDLWPEKAVLGSFVAYLIITDAVSVIAHMQRMGIPVPVLLRRIILRGKDRLEKGVSSTLGTDDE